VVIRYALGVDRRWDACADYAIRLLLDGIGVPCTRVEPSGQGADLVYSVEQPADLSDGVLWIRAAEIPDWNTADAELGWSTKLPVVRAGPQPGESADPVHVADDIVYSTYAIVTGALEQQAPKDACGVPVGRKSRLQAAGVLARPAIAIYCEYLASMLERRRRSELVRVPRWPSGKTYAVVLSHDVDVPFRRAPWPFYARRLRTNIARADPRAAVHGLLHMAKAAAVTRLAPLPDPAVDPNFCFDAWIELEASLTASSCFYVAVTTSADAAGSPFDVTYDFRHPAIIDRLRRAIDAGWEVGLHASINARRIPDRLHVERELLEDALAGYRVRGVRHHYWALDPELPERTLWGHADAGLHYDSSFGLNDVPGFRRGMMWPYRPFDRERAQEVATLEVPPTLMDGSIFYRRVTAADGRGRIEAHLATVRDLGGAAVLDWHQEQLNPARLHGAGPALAAVLAELRGDSAVYWATPAQLAAWWASRRERIEASA
jgi:hypothetical protein